MRPPGWVLVSRKVLGLNPGQASAPAGAFFIPYSGMAFTVEQSPEGYVAGSRHPIPFVVYDDTNTGEDQYKYICDIYIGGVKVNRLFAFPNDADAGVFDISRFVDDSLTHQVFLDSVTSNGVNNSPIILLGRTGFGINFDNNTNAIHRVELKFGYQFVASGGTQPTVTADVSTGNYLTVFKANHTLRENAKIGRDENSATSSVWEVFDLSATTDQFISAVPSVDKDASIVTASTIYEQDIEYGQAGVISWLNDEATSSQSLAPNHIHVAGYQSDGTQLFTGSFVNSGLYGGQVPASVSSDTNRLIFFGSGEINLRAQTANLTVRNGFLASTPAYYEIVASESSSLGADQCSAVYRFNVVDSCRYETRRIAFINAYGGWDFFNFTLRSEKSVEMKRQSYTRIRGNYGTAGSSVGFFSAPFDRGKKTLNTNVMQKEVLNSDWIGEDWNDFFLQLYSSPEVYIIRQSGGVDQEMIPVTITDTNYKLRTSQNTGLINHTVNIEYANYLSAG